MARQPLRFAAAVVLTVATGMLPSAALAAPGDLDPSFGSGGNVTTDLGGNGGAGVDVVVQPDGKIGGSRVRRGAAAGSSRPGADGAPAERRLERRADRHAGVSPRLGLRRRLRARFQARDSGSHAASSSRTRSCSSRVTSAGSFARPPATSGRGLPRRISLRRPSRERRRGGAGAHREHRHVDERTDVVRVPVGTLRCRRSKLRFDRGGDRVDLHARLDGHRGHYPGVDYGQRLGCNIGCVDLGSDGRCATSAARRARRTRLRLHEPGAEHLLRRSGWWQDLRERAVRRHRRLPGAGDRAVGKAADLRTPAGGVQASLRARPRPRTRERRG